MKNKFKLFFSISALLFSLVLLVSAQNAPPPPPKPSPPPGIPGSADLEKMLREQEQPPENSTIRGRVFYQNTGRPVRRSSIVLLPEKNGKDYSGLTDSNGYFEVKNVRAGTYYPLVNAPGVISPLAYIDFRQSRGDGIGSGLENFPAIVVNGINDLDVQIPAIQGGSISGRVTYENGDPAIGVKIEILRKVENKFLPLISNLSNIFSMLAGGGIQTDDRGMYRFSGLPGGEYIIKATENVSHSESSEDYSGHSYIGAIFGEMGGKESLLTVYYPEALAVGDAQIISVNLGMESYEMNLVIPDRNLYRVSGKIISSKDNSPVENVKLTLKKANDPTVSLFDNMPPGLRQGNKSNGQGLWNFKELPRGTYHLVIEPPQSSGDYYDYGSNTVISNGATDDEIDKPKEPEFSKQVREIVIEDQNLSNIIIELGYGATISGNVKTENSDEMPGNVSITAMGDVAEIMASTSVYNRNYEDENTKRRNHRFKLENIPVGKNHLYISIEDEDFYVKSATIDNKNLLAAPLELKEGEHLSNVKITLAKDVGTVKGDVLDTNKRSAPFATFMLVPVDSTRRRNSTFYRQLISDKNGEFELKVPPDEYAVLIFGEIAPGDYEGFLNWLDDAIKTARKITVKPNETTKVSLVKPTN